MAVTAFRFQHPDITDDMWIQIDEIIDRNKPRSGSIITVLRECQDVVGYLPVELIDYIGDGMNLSRSEVYGVASFYALFSMEPKGRHTVKLCLGTACYVKGIKEVLDRISNEYQVKEGGNHRRPAVFPGSGPMFGSLRFGSGDGDQSGYSWRCKSRWGSQNIGWLRINHLSRLCCHANIRD